MRPKELRDLHDNLTGLIEAGQAPAVEAILRQRFLLRIRGEGEPAWIAYGFLVARDLAASLASFSLDGLPPEELDRLVEAIRFGDAHPVPPYADPDRWASVRDAALARLADASARVERILRGEDPFSRDAEEDGEGRTVRIPVVARLRGNAHADPVFRGLAIGTGIRLTVEADGRMRRREKAGVGVGGNANREARLAFRAALAALPRLPIRTALPPERCDFDVRWDPPALLFGGSAGLGFAVASASAWSSLSTRPSEERPAPGIAFTGALEGTGVAAVEETTLARKVEACFYSGVRILFVPASQLGAAEAAAEALHARHPERTLPIRGAADLRDLWKDPEAVRTVRRPLGRTARVTARLFTASRWALLLPALVLAVAAGLVVRDRVLSDPNPVEAFWEGNELVAVNEHGRETGRAAPAAGHPEHVFELGKDRKGVLLAVSDLDGDGRREVIAGCEEQPGRVNLLIVFDSELNVRWTKRANEVGGDHLAGLPDFAWHSFRVRFSDREGLATISAMRNTPQGPVGLIGWLDGSNGKDRWAFLNNGHMEGAYSVDLDKDGKAECVFLGTDHSVEREGKPGMGILSVISSDRCSSPPPGNNWEKIPLLIDPESIGKGLLFSVRFPLDRFACTRAHCKNFVEEKKGVYRVFVMGTSNVEGWGVSYLIDLRNLDHPKLVRVFFHEGPRAQMMITDSNLTGADFDEELRRLALEVHLLTKDGWELLPLTGRRTQ